MSRAVVDAIDARGRSALGPVKYCLNKAGFGVGSPRLPLIDVDADTAAFLDGLLSRYEIDLPIGAAA